MSFPSPIHKPSAHPMASKVRPSHVTGVAHWSRTRNGVQNNMLTKRSGTSYRPRGGPVLRWVRIQIPTSHREELFPHHNFHLKHLARFLPEKDGFLQPRFPRRLYVLALCVESNHASQTTVVVDDEREHCARISRWRGDTPSFWWKGGTAPNRDGSISIWGGGIRLDPQKVKWNRLPPASKVRTIQKERFDSPTRL